MNQETAAFASLGTLTDSPFPCFYPDAPIRLHDYDSIVADANCTAGCRSSTWVPTTWGTTMGQPGGESPSSFNFQIPKLAAFQSPGLELGFSATLPAFPLSPSPTSLPSAFPSLPRSFPSPLLPFPPCSAAFTSTYVQFMVNASRTHYGDASLPFFVAQGPMNDSDTLYQLLQWVIGNYTAQGGKATYLDMRGQPTDGCGGHPGRQGHAGMAAAAIPQIAAAMGW